VGEDLSLTTSAVGEGVSSDTGEAGAVGSGVGAADDDVAVGTSVAKGVGLDGVLSDVCD